MAFSGNENVTVSAGDSQVSEREILELINELSQVQEEMLDFFTRKRQAMAKGDTSEQERFSEEESSLNDRLTACHQRRTELLSRDGSNTQPVESLSQMVERLPNGNRSRLQAQIQQSQARTNQVRMEALATWVVAQRNLLDCSQKLEILATGGQGKPTYGEGESSFLRGNLVNEEA